MGGPWNTSRDATLRQHWADGFSASLIGQMMGLSRNSIIGRAHRLGLPKRQSKRTARSQHIKKVWNGTERPKKILRPLRKSPPVRREPMPIPVSLDVKLLDLETHQCRWISSGEGAGALYCGHPSDAPYGYCGAHHAIVYVPAEPRTRREVHNYDFFGIAA